MRTLKDLKLALQDIPDELLDFFAVGVGEGTEETISIVAFSDMYNQKFTELFEYKDSEDLVNFFSKIIAAQSILDNCDASSDRLFELIEARGISSDMNFDDLEEELNNE